MQIKTKTSQPLSLVTFPGRRERKEAATKETEGPVTGIRGNPRDSVILEAKGNRFLRRRQLSVVSDSPDGSGERKAETNP